METCKPNIVTLLNKYSISKKDGTYLQELITRILDSEPVIPVLGMQGMGKSTLINAVLEENILPSEADETTCVPVEIKYGTHEHAEITFSNSSEMVKANTIDELREYVDNNYNPANDKGVLKIVLYRNREILKSGIVIVDLPGVGSVTQTNGDTTIKYIQNLCTAIFVIPTVPTIRREEALFIKAVWSQFSEAIFVQNDWGESEQEIKESVDFNSKLLKGIAKELKTGFTNEILVINAFNALAGALRKDEKLRKTSNVDALLSQIHDLSMHWKHMQEASVKEKQRITADASIQYAQKQIDECCRTHDEIIKQRDKELTEMQQKTNILEEKVYDINNFVDQKKFEFRSFARTSATECVKKIRVSMNKTIDSGVYDGEALTTVFNDEQKEKIAEYLDVIFDKQVYIKSEVDDKLQDLCTFDIERNDDVDTQQVNKDHAFRYEKGIDFLCKIGGAVAGVAACSKIGVIVGSAIAPGPGTVVGVIVGAVVGLVGSFIGSFFKRKISEKRAAETKRGLEPLYDKIQSIIFTNVTDAFASYADNLKTALDTVIRERRNQEREFKEHLYEVNDAINIEEIKSDILVLTQFKESL